MEDQRIKAVEPPYSKQLQEDFDFIMPEGIPPLNIFRTVANNPRVLRRMVKGGLLDKGSISLAQRELVILRTCGLCKAEYEWGVHVAAFAVKAGFNQQQVENTASEKINPELWDDTQLLILELVGALHESQACGEELWNRLSSQFQADQLIELIMLAGLYHAVSFVVNALKIEKEAFAPVFPK